MEMTEKEIVDSYNNAAYKTKQVGILADLNGVSKQCIEELLIKNGAVYPPKKGPKPKAEVHKENIQAYAQDMGVSEEQAKKELEVKATLHPTIPAEVRILVENRIDELSNKIQLLQKDIAAYYGEMSVLESYLKQDNKTQDSAKATPKEAWRGHHCDECKYYIAHYDADNCLVYKCINPESLAFTTPTSKSQICTEFVPKNT